MEAWEVSGLPARGDLMGKMRPLPVVLTSGSSEWANAETRKEARAVCAFLLARVVREKFPTIRGKRRYAEAE